MPTTETFIHKKSRKNKTIKLAQNCAGIGIKQLGTILQKLTSFFAILWLKIHAEKKVFISPQNNETS